MIQSHARELEGSGISPEIASEQGVYTAEKYSDLPASFQQEYSAQKAQKLLPALVYLMSDVNGNDSWQVKPPRDTLSEGRKYLSPFKSHNPIKLGAVSFDPADAGKPIVIIEGVKQPLAALTAGIADKYRVLRSAGIYGWSAGNGVPTEQLRVVKDAEVIIVPNADARSNYQVCSGLHGLMEACKEFGAKSVSAATVPSGSAGAKTGLDDYLVDFDPSRRYHECIRVIEDTRSLTQVKKELVALKKSYKRQVQDEVAHFALETVQKAVHGKQIVGVDTDPQALLDRLVGVVNNDRR